MNQASITLTSLLILLSSFQAFSFQNVKELLDNPDITWIGEVYVDYLPNISIIESVDAKVIERYGVDDYNIFEILKIQSPVNEDWLNPSQSLLSSRLLQMNANSLDIYEDAALTKKLSYEGYKKATKYIILDTLITFDPETFEEIVQVIINNLNPIDIVVFRVKQLLTYNAKTNQLNIIPLAIAPIVTTRNKTSLRKDILFWMPIKNVFNSINLNESSIDWAKRLTKDVPSKSVKTIKGTGTVLDVFDQMLAYYKANPSTSKLYYSFGSKLTPFETSHIELMGSSVDTIITFHPETFEEIVRVVKNDLVPQFAVKIRLIQDWVWDNKTQKMQIRVLGYGPVLERIDFKTRYWPFYYVKAEK